MTGVREQPTRVDGLGQDKVKDFRVVLLELGAALLIGFDQNQAEIGATGLVAGLGIARQQQNLACCVSYGVVGARTFQRIVKGFPIGAEAGASTTTSSASVQFGYV